MVELASQLRTLDLGCFSSPRSLPGALAFGIDLAAMPPDSDSRIQYGVDLAISGLSFPDNHFDRIYAHDFLEHLPRVVYIEQQGKLRSRFCHIELFNGIWRCLKPGGVFESVTPVWPNASACLSDPTHLSIWHRETWNYYIAKEGRNFEYALMRAYGFVGNFDLLRCEPWHSGSHLLVELQAKK